jgi:hypothetical protein
MAVDTIEKLIFSVLSNDGTVSGLVAARIYPMVVPRNASYPAITYQQTAGDREHTMAGPIGMVDSRFVINCWATTYNGARALSDAVRIALDGNSTDVGSQALYVIFLENETDTVEQKDGVRELRRFAKQLDFTVWFKESTS